MTPRHARTGTLTRSHAGPAPSRRRSARPDAPSRPHASSRALRSTPTGRPPPIRSPAETGDPPPPRRRPRIPPPATPAASPATQPYSQDGNAFTAWNRPASTADTEPDDAIQPDTASSTAPTATRTTSPGCRTYTTRCGPSLGPSPTSHSPPITPELSGVAAAPIPYHYREISMRRGIRDRIERHRSEPLEDDERGA